MNPSVRRYIIIGFAVLAAILYIIRLFYIQVVEDKYKLDAQNQAFLYVTDYPPRGAIYDRNGKILVYNQVAYDLMVVPRDMKDCDTIELCKILNITKDEFGDRLVHLCGSLDNASKDYRSYIFESQMLPELNARIQERLYEFKGFYVQSRTVRKYTYTIAAHLLGYVNEVSDKIVKDDTTGFYQPGDYIGASGIEKSYEKYLRGKKGVQIKMRDVHNNIKGSFKDGKYDTAAVPGLSLTATLDADLQAYGEQLMQNKIGGIAAIDPSTGEILALITSPTYDPNLLVGRDLRKNYSLLSGDTAGNPLYNRALQAMYPPGSTFKLMNSLIAQQEGVLTADTRYPCAGGYPPLGGHPKCEHHPSPLDLTGAIQYSCNSYFSYVFHSIVANRKYKHDRDGFDAWRNYVLSFGVGKKMGTDLPFELKGNVPTSQDYDKVFGKGSWNASTVTGVGLGIGQGELLVTPLQMCNIICSIANRGFYYVPHVIKNIGDGENKIVLPQWSVKNYTMVTDTNYYNIVINAMNEVVKAGTARASYIPGIDLCGKTGTAQNPHGKDHSVFVCFAPREHPKIAVAVLVENAGWGAQWAAPIASLLVEKYLTGKISRPEIEKRMLDGDLIHAAPDPKEQKHAAN
ncbi:MAG: penicillin-binding protein 2 [Bacteroidetes bacterium]|nr:penicillin-binding protein 2 [Bacteroidota bacterium]